MSHVRFHVGRKEQPPGYRFVSDSYDQFHVIVVQEGRLFFAAAERERELGPGTVLALRHGAAFRLHCLESGYRGVCCITPQHRPEWTGEALAGAADASILEAAERIRRESLSPGFGATELLEGYGRVMAWLALRRLSEQPRVADDRDYAAYWAGRARAALEAAAYAGQGAREILADLGLSYRQIARHVQWIEGKTPKAVLREIRMGEACRLLRQTRQPVTALALDLGFASSQHFATQFRRHTGMTPTAYRKSGA